MAKLGDPVDVVRWAELLHDMSHLLSRAEGATEASWWIMYQVKYAVENWHSSTCDDTEFAEHLIDNLMASLKNLREHVEAIKEVEEYHDKVVGS